MTNPTIGSFRWEDIDQRLISPKLEELAGKMHKRASEAEQKAAFETRQSGNFAGYLPRLFEAQRQLADEWAQELYNLHCDVWRIQGNSVSPDFIRVVRDRAIVPLIGARKGAVVYSAQLWCTRTGRHSSAVALGHWNRTMNSLANQWSRRLDAEAVAAEYRKAQEAARQRDNTLPLSLPTGLQSSGDPILENPFPVGSFRHKVWDDATQKAEEEWCRFNLESEDLSNPSGVLLDSICKRIARRFDIWAERGVHVVWGDADRGAYDQWLINYAESWLRDVHTKKLYDRVVPMEDLIASLRLILTKRVNWWKAEARRYLAIQKANSAPEPPASVKSEPVRRPRSNEPKPVKADVKLEAPTKYPTMTVPEVMTLLTLSRSTVYRYIAEGRLNRPGLNKRPGKRAKTLILTASVKKMLEEVED